MHTNLTMQRKYVNTDLFVSSFVLDYLQISDAVVLSRAQHPNQTFVACSLQFASILKLVKRHVEQQRHQHDRPHSEWRPDVDVRRHSTVRSFLVARSRVSKDVTNHVDVTKRCGASQLTAPVLPFMWLTINSFSTNNTFS